MSDAPLFQNADEQEAAYAPQQLPEGSHEGARATAEDSIASSNASTKSVILPAAAAGSTSGTTSNANPGIGAVAAADAHDELDQPDDRRD